MSNILDFNTAKTQAQAEADLRTRSQVDAEDIKARITASAQSFVEFLFSGRALVSRGEARIGDVNGTPGASLSIQLRGPNAGLWHDHATGEGGDLIALYQAYMGYQGGRNFQLALKEIAKDFLGDPVEVERAPWQPSVQQRIEEKKTKLGTKPRADMLELGAPVKTFRYTDLEGRQIASVVRYEPDGTRESKTFRPYCFDINGNWNRGAPERHRPLYKLPRLVHASRVVLCEGEGKADALIELGIDATSAMQGAESPIDKTDWDILRGKEVLVWPDNDEPGLKYARSVSAHLTALGCKVSVVPIPPGTAPKWDAVDCVQEGKNPHDYLSRAIPWEQAPGPTSRLKLLSLSEIEALPPPQWLVDGIITVGGLSVVWGRSGSFKSFVALDQAMAIATPGARWQGREVKHGLVVFVAAEGAHGLAKRAMGWRHAKGKDLGEPMIRLLPHSIVMNSDDTDQLILAIRALGQTPVLIVIDTLARTFGTGDENKTSDMNAFVTAVDRLRVQTGAHVMIVHHSGKDEERGERGNLALRGAADTVINVARDGDKVRLINEAPKGKQKDSEEFPTVTLRTQSRDFEHNGEWQKTLVLMPDDDPLPTTGGAPKASSAPSGGVQKTILALIKKHGPLARTRLQLLTKRDESSVRKAVGKLVEEGFLEADGDAFKIPEEVSE